MEMLKGSRITSTPKHEMIKQLKTYVDVTREASDVPPPMGTTDADEAVPMADDEQEWQQEQRRGRKRSSPDIQDNIIPEEKKKEVQELKRRWNQLVSVNKNRRQEGLPPLMELPPAADRPQDPGDVSDDAEGILGCFKIKENEDTKILDCSQVQEQDWMTAWFASLSDDKKEEVAAELDRVNSYEKETAMLCEKIEQEKQDEHLLLTTLHDGYDKSKSAWFIEFDLDADNMNAFVSNSMLYVKKVLESKGTEVRYDRLDS